MIVQTGLSVLIGQSQQMILILFGTFHAFRHFAVRQIFQIQTDFSLQQPHERIHPTYNGDQFADDHIHGMSLTDVSQFVHQNLLTVVFLQMRQMDKYPPEERERIACFLQADYTNSVHPFLLSPPHQREDTEQLDQKAKGHHPYSDHPHISQHRHQVGCRRNRSRFNHHFIHIDPFGIIVGQAIHRGLLLHPMFEVERRIKERHRQKSE